MGWIPERSRALSESGRCKLIALHFHGAVDRPYRCFQIAARTLSNSRQLAFNWPPPAVGDLIIGPDLVRIVLSGGYPEILERPFWARRQKWFLDYLKAIIERDVRHVAKVDHLRQMPRLLRILAQHSGQLVNYSAIAAPLAISHVTTQKYVGIFEKLYLLRTLPPWHGNEIKRLVKAPKLHFLDSGLLAALRNLSPERLQSDRTVFGSLLETFVLAELLKIATWSDGHFEFHHFRDRYDNEVDVVIEDQDGHVVAKPPYFNNSERTSGKSSTFLGRARRC